METVKEKQVKDIRDYLHLYIGCEVEYGFEDRKYRGELIGHDYRWGWQVSNPNPFVPFRFCKVELIKPILRRFFDMTEEEAVEYIGVRGYSKVLDVEIKDNGVEFTHPGAVTWLAFDKGNPQAFVWLLSKGFDLFNLIPDKLAIDKATLPL